MIKLINGDSKEVLKTFDDNIIDSVVTDPPYGLTTIVKRFGKENSAPAKEGKDGRFKRLSKGFMGKEWDGSGIEYDVDFWKEVYRVMKPGAHLLAFSSARTYHKMTTAIEESGFEIRDMITWNYSQGFPKSHNLGNGWGTALKPSVEPICLARKPISEKTVLLNMQKWGVGGINIDESRVELNNGEVVPINVLEKWSGFGEEDRPNYTPTVNTKGRWPANVILDEEAGKILDQQSGFSKSIQAKTYNIRNRPAREIYGDDFPQSLTPENTYNDSGGASRFFYCPKANPKERGESNNHPTVKPIKLMEYLVRLLTPKNGLVLDPFSGSFTTGVACKNLGYSFIGIELNEDYYNIGVKRLNNET